MDDMIAHTITISSTRSHMSIELAPHPLISRKGRKKTVHQSSLEIMGNAKHIKSTYPLYTNMQCNALSNVDSQLTANTFVTLTNETDNNFSTFQ